VNGDPTVPISLGYWILALVPVVTLLVLLIGLRWSAAQAGATGFLVTAALALIFFETPMKTLGVATAKGFWDALFILYIVWGALLLYEVARAGQVFDSFREGISSFTPNQLVQFLAFAFVFVLFLQSTAGFGTPIAVVAPLLIGLGVRPVWAVSLALIGHVWGNTYGSLAISWVAMELVVDVSEATTTHLVASGLLFGAVAASGFTLTYLYGGMSAIRNGWPLLVALVAIYGIGQMIVAPIVPEMAAIMPATIAVGALFVIARRSRYQEADVIEREERILQDKETDSESEAGAEDATGAEQQGEKPSLAFGFVPYFALIAFTLLGAGLTEFSDRLDNIAWGFFFPEVSTGYDIVQGAEDPYSALNPISHAGTAILLSAVVGYAVFRKRGYIAAEERPTILKNLTKNAVPTSVAIVGFLTLAAIMEHSGQTYVLANGLADVLPSLLYPAAALVIGVLGAFITSSNTASNVLFAPLHVETASLLNVSEGAVLGSQMAGGAFGNAIAPANVALGTGTAQIAGKEGAVLRTTLIWTLAVTAIGAVGVTLVALML
jgi:lactate permease